ncbi:MAG: phosphoglycerate dehydrogenase [Deltaproteobacteria bacterium]|nr:phosphoglycerate dehydrogenase [Deltaproteobacteria bacterium]
MVKVLVSDKLSPHGLEILKSAGLQVDFKTGLKPEELKKIISQYEALVIRSSSQVTADILEAADKLQVIGRAGIGVDNVDLPAASKKGIVVMNTPSGNAVTTAEHAIAMMFAVSRKIPQATASLRSGKWEKGKFMGSELCNKVLGIVGVGNIGKIVADRALGLKMRVVGYDPFLSEEAAQKLGIQLATLDDIFARADYITVHTPLNEKTKNLIGKGAFTKMKKGVYIINCARGGIVNEIDLMNAIKEGIVAGAALDVFEKEPPAPDHPLLQMEQVIFTPHLGAATDEAQENVAIEIAEQIADYFKTGTIRNAVNFPSISAEARAFLQPYISLAEKLGSLQGQLVEKLPSELLIEYRGDITGRSLSPVTIGFLKGLLSHMLSDVSVNYVNAPVIAQERGMKVIESKIREHADFANLMTVTLKSGQESFSVSGTIFGKTNPRIVRIDDFYLEAVPEGKILVIHNHDRPGVIGNIGTLLGQKKVNISRMQLGMEKGGSEAMALYNVEGNITPDVIVQIEKLPNIISVKVVDL